MKGERLPNLENLFSILMNNLYANNHHSKSQAVADSWGDFGYLPKGEII